MSGKKSLILYVLKILETETDERHPMTQTELTSVIASAMPCDRKTVGRNINALIDMGYPIVKTRAGCYLSGRKFDSDEIKYVLAAVRGEELPAEMSPEERAALADRLRPVLNRLYRTYE